MLLKNLLDLKILRQFETLYSLWKESRRLQSQIDRYPHKKHVYINWKMQVFYKKYRRTYVLNKHQYRIPNKVLQYSYNMRIFIPFFLREMYIKVSYTCIEFEKLPIVELNSSGMVYYRYIVFVCQSQNKDNQICQKCCYIFISNIFTYICICKSLRVSGCTLGDTFSFHFTKRWVSFSILLRT